MTSGAFQDMNDNLVDIGTVVAFTEFCETPDTEGKTYIVREMPNCGDTVIMAECLIGDEGEVTDILRESPITVKPFQIGAI